MSAAAEGDEVFERIWQRWIDWFKWAARAVVRAKL